MDEWSSRVSQEVEEYVSLLYHYNFFHYISFLHIDYNIPIGLLFYKNVLLIYLVQIRYNFKVILILT